MYKKNYLSPKFGFVAYEDEDVITASFGYKTDEEGNDDNDIGYWNAFSEGGVTQ